MSGGGSVGGAVVFGWGVEFVPVDAGAVSHRDHGRLPCAQRAVFPGFPVERLVLSVRDGVGREPRVGFRMPGVLVAPPAHRALTCRIRDGPRCRRGKSRMRGLWL